MVRQDVIQLVVLEVMEDDWNHILSRNFYKVLVLLSGNRVTKVETIVLENTEEVLQGGNGHSSGGTGGRGAWGNGGSGGGGGGATSLTSGVGNAYRSWVAVAAAVMVV